MKNRFILSTSITATLAVFLMLACQPKTVSSEEPVGVETPIAIATPTPAESITIAAVGDIMLGSTSINDTFLPPNDGADILKEVTPILSNADIAFGNLEGPMLEGGETTKCPPRSTRCFAFRVPTRYGKHLKNAGFDVLSLANNHSLDFGDPGRVSTRKTLDDNGIKHAGSDKEQYSTAYLDVKGRRVAVIAFAHNTVVPNVNDLVFARQLVSDAALNANIVIVSFHGGAEGTGAQHVPNRTEIFAGEKRGNLPLFARTVIDAGADLVLGHGPHVLRGMEIYKDRLISYSLGNFATYGMFRLEGETAITAILDVTLDADGKFISGKINAGKQEGRGGPVLDKTGTAIRIMRNLSIADFGRNAPHIAGDGTISLN
ncbi:MAG: CapA family protein [Pyrinomonadaceae bacterium]